MAHVLSRILATAPLTSLPFNNINDNRKILNLRSAFVPQNGLRKGFSCSGLRWKLEKRGGRVGVRCEAGVAEKEAPETPGEKFEYQAEVGFLSFSGRKFVWVMTSICSVAERNEKKKKKL